MLLSVIIPAYNAEQNIEATLQSVLCDPSDWFEVIVVNDGSTDNTLRLCNEVTMSDNRLKVVSINNGGVSNARNVGIKASRGEYITFLDADDGLATGWAQIIKDLVNRISSDLYVFGYNICANDISRKQIIPFVPGNIDVNYFYKQLVENTKMNYCWGKVYKANFLKEKNVQFPVGIKIGEDVQFQIDLLECNPRIFASSEILVNYNQVENSVMHSFSVSKFASLEDDYKLRKQLLQKIGNDPVASKTMYNELAGVLLSYLRQYTRMNGECVSILNRLRGKRFFDDIVANSSFTKKHPERIIFLIMLRMKLYRLVETVFKRV